MSKAIKFRNNTYLDVSSISFLNTNYQEILMNQPKCFNLYNVASANQYLVIDTKSTNLYEMIHAKVIGNGYGIAPIDSVIQGYSYEPLGNFLNCKIHNNSCSLSAWFILDTTIKLVIQVPSSYMSFSIMIWTPIHQLQAHHSIYYADSGFPAYTKRVQCTVV